MQKEVLEDRETCASPVLPNTSTKYLNIPSQRRFVIFILYPDWVFPLGTEVLFTLQSNFFILEFQNKDSNLKIAMI